MKQSLISRVAATLFIFIAGTMVLSMVVVELFVNDIENSILELELKADADYFKAQLRSNSFESVKTGRLEAMFVPAGSSETVLPEYLRGLTTPFSNEIEVNSKTLLVYGESIDNPAGQLFLAQDITIMENREFLVQLVLISVAGVMLLISFLVARAGAFYLLHPFRKLTNEILAIVPESSMSRISADYTEKEFFDIAKAFNRFVSELELHISREQSFVKLASHELRTPLAVMSGALDVLQQRQTISEADQKTLRRIRRAVQTMQDDTEVLLELARGNGLAESLGTVVMQEILQNTIDDLAYENPEYVGRVSVTNSNPGMKIETRPALVRMLFRNLLQNALRHTRAAVEVNVAGQLICVKDFGAGLPGNLKERINMSELKELPGSRAGDFGDTTFGLLIVRLVCEKLGWKLEVSQSDSRGTEFVISVQDSC